MSAAAASPTSGVSFPEDLSWKPSFNPWAVALTVTMATFMEVIDTSIVNVALPNIAGNLSVSYDEATWVLTSYLVSNALVLPLSGWISNRIGRKRFYMTCVAIFTISSMLCGLAPNLPTLILCRVLQGIGGGGLGPSEQAILTDTFPPRMRGQAFALYGMAVVLAPALGPTLGGIITDHFTWRWCFFINIPVGILSLFLSNRMVEDPPWIHRATQQRAPIDYIGLSMLSLGLISLELVLDKGQEDDWFNSNFILRTSIFAAVMLVSFIVWELRQEHPIINLRLFKERTFAVSNLMMFILGATLFGSTALMPLFMQTQLRYTAQLSGMALSPGGLVIMSLMPLVGILITRVDPRKLVMFGFFGVSLGMYYTAHHLSTNIEFRTLVFMRIIQVFGLAFLFVPINTISYGALPPGTRSNDVTGIVNLSRNMGGDVGIAFVTTMLTRRAQIHQTDLASHLTAMDPTFQSTLRGMTQVLMHGGYTFLEGQRRALGIVYQSLSQQANALATVEIVSAYSTAALCVIPLALLMKRPNAAGGPVGGH